MTLALILTASGCAHRREVVYPSRVQTDRGAWVRAPVVDVRVPIDEPSLDVDRPD